jgi:hypothetical protein
VYLPDGGPATVVEVYDDEHGREGGVQATLVVERQAVTTFPARRRAS